MQTHRPTVPDWLRVVMCLSAVAAVLGLLCAAICGVSFEPFVSIAVGRFAEVSVRGAFDVRS